MQIEYKLEADDFLTYQLFTASKSARIKKKKMANWIGTPVSLVLLAVIFYLIEMKPLAIYFGLVALASASFYPMYFKWKYKRHYKGFIKENYAKRIGMVGSLEFQEEVISFHDKTGEAKINLSEIEDVIELLDHFLLKFSTGVSLIIPKREIDTYGLKEKFKELGLPVRDELNWKWGKI